MNLADAVSSVLILAGASLALTGAVGLHRLPDLYARIHAATKPATLGILCCLGAAAIQFDDTATRAKLLLAIVLQLLTAPAAAHLLSRTAHERGEPHSPFLVEDDLATDRP